MINLTRPGLAIALDVPDLATACRVAAAVSGSAGVVKVGLETYLRDGAEGVAQIRAAAPRAAIFLDLKLHDIPATVAGGARSIAGLAPEIMTVHASGGATMVAAAVHALPDTLVAAVTVLTSLDAATLELLGIAGPPQEAAVRLALLAVGAGARAVVCSPAEVAAVRAAVGADVLLITPGVRPAGAALGDQVRVATPEQAIAAGADLLVVGRPVTAAADPAAAAAAILASIASLH